MRVKIRKRTRKSADLADSDRSDYSLQPVRPVGLEFKNPDRSDRFQRADCPRLSSGLSATHLRQSTRDNNVSGRISNPKGGPSGPPWRTVRSSLCPTTRDDSVSGQNSRLRRSVRSPIADRPQFNPANPTRDNIVSGQILISTADCPLSNSGPSAVQFYENTKDNIISGQLLT